MEFKLKITMADPAGNRTAFAEGEVPPELYAAVGAAILKEEDLNAEQAGFLLKPLRGAAGRMEMMGGEFCGNASRSFGLLLGRRNGMKAGERIPVEVSGSKDILEVLLEEDGSWVSMPLPQAITELSLPRNAAETAVFPLPTAADCSAFRPWFWRESPTSFLRMSNLLKLWRTLFSTRWRRKRMWMQQGLSLSRTVR